MYNSLFIFEYLYIYIYIHIHVKEVIQTTSSIKLIIINDDNITRLIIFEESVLLLQNIF